MLKTIDDIIEKCLNDDKNGPKGEPPPASDWDELLKCIKANAKYCKIPIPDDLEASVKGKITEKERTLAPNGSIHDFPPPKI